VAQLLSLLAVFFGVSKLVLPLIAVDAILNINITNLEPKKHPPSLLNKLGHIPIGIFIGTMSLCRDCGHYTGESLKHT